MPSKFDLYSFHPFAEVNYLQSTLLLPQSTFSRRSHTGIPSPEVQITLCGLHWRGKQARFSQQRKLQVATGKPGQHVIMKFGIDRLLSNAQLQRELSGKRLGLVGNSASLTDTLRHSLDALMASDLLNPTAAFGPQHGMRADKQDNMV